MASNILTWTDTNTASGTTSNETEVRIYRSNSFFTTGSLPSILATLAADTTTYTDATVADGDSRYYMVSAFNNGVEKFTDCRLVITSTYIGIETTITIATIDYKLVKFYESGIFTLPANKTLDMLVVGNGGNTGSTHGGSLYCAGGGGGGRVRTMTSAYEQGSYSIIIDIPQTAVGQGANGASVWFNDVESEGGSGGGSGNNGGGAQHANTGGWNGGGGARSNTTYGNGSTGVGGFNGVNAHSVSGWRRGGGGGGSGGHASGKDGGIGVQSDITGINTYYGGGGASKLTSNNTNGTRGQGIIGGGGGDTGLVGSPQQLGHLGIVILRYPVL